MQAAEYLLINYNNLGNKDKANECISFLGDQKKPEGEDKALVSKLEDLFKTYMDQKRQKEAEEIREKFIKKTIGIIVPIAILIALAVFIVVKQRSKTLLKKKQEEADRKLGETEQKHEKQRAALSNQLQERDKALSAMQKRLEAATFGEEPICRHIMDVEHDQQFKAKVDYLVYKDYALSTEQLLALREAADRHFGQFTTRLRQAYPDLTKGDVDYCCLYLLGLEESDIAALMQRAYTTVCDRSRKLKGIFGSDDSITTFVRNFAKHNIYN